MAGDLGFVIGPLLVGAIADTGAFWMGFVASGVALLIAAGAVMTIGETREKVVEA
jgi:dipeptide/tripeptide permease